MKDGQMDRHTDRRTDKVITTGPLSISSGGAQIFVQVSA